MMTINRGPTCSRLEIRNLSEKYFTVEKFAMISSILNTRRCYAQISFQDGFQTNFPVRDSRIKKTADSAKPLQTAVTISTECSGMDTPVTALEKILKNVRRLSSSDICPAAKKSILANHRPDYFYDDLTNRDYEKLKTRYMYCRFPVPTIFSRRISEWVRRCEPRPYFPAYLTVHQHPTTQVFHT